MLRELLHRFSGTRPLRVIDAEVLGVNGNVIGQAPLFERYFLFEIPAWVPRFGGGAVYLHHYLRSDPDRGVHDHPWDHALAVQLAGGYFEERFCGVSPEGIRKRIVRRPAGRGYVLKGSDFHRVLVAGEAFFGRGHDVRGRDFLPFMRSGGAATSWSLFAHGPYRKGWGFLQDDGPYVDGNDDKLAILIFRPFKNENDGSSKWWRGARKGRDQARADEWGRPHHDPVDGLGLDLAARARVGARFVAACASVNAEIAALEHAARRSAVAEDVQ